MEEDNTNWDNFLLLATIMDYVFAPVVTVHASQHLETVIEDFLVGFRQLYPERRLTPKMHHLIHVPSYVRRFDKIMH